MSIDKKVKYDVQGGVKNYLGKQQQVKAPLKWKSSPDSPETELAYITKAEKDLLVKQDLHGSLQGGVNRGPSGIMSLDGYGSIEDGVDVGMSGAATSAAETGGGSGADARELAAESGRVRSDLGLAQLPPGVVDQNVQDYRNEFIAAGGGQRVNPGFFDDRNTVSPAELAAAKAYDRSAFSKNRRGGIMDFITGGGFLGNIVRGIGQKFGLGKRYNEPTYDMRQFSNINPTYYNDFDNELMSSTEATPPTLDLSKLKTGDLNNLASLISASQMPQDLDEIGKGAGYVGYDKNELAAIAAGTKIPKLGDLTSFIDPLATITARERELKNYFDSPVEPQEGIMGIDVGSSNDLMADASAPGNNFLYNTGNPYKDNLYDSEGNYDPYGIKGEPEPEVREIAIG